MTEITCNGCKRRHHIKSFRYDMSGENLICQDCYTASKGKPVLPPKIDELKPTGPREKTEAMVNFYCTDCRYKFTRRKGFKFVICPSCSTPGTIKQEVNMSSSELLDTCDDVFG